MIVYNNYLEIKAEYKIVDKNKKIIWIYYDILSFNLNREYNIIINELSQYNYIFIPLSKIIYDSNVYGNSTIFNYYIKLNQYDIVTQESVYYYY